MPSFGRFVDTMEDWLFPGRTIVVSTGGTDGGCSTQEHPLEEHISPTIAQQSVSHRQIFLTTLDVTAGKSDNKFVCQVAIDGSLKPAHG